MSVTKLVAARVPHVKADLLNGFRVPWSPGQVASRVRPPRENTHFRVVTVTNQPRLPMKWGYCQHATAHAFQNATRDGATQPRSRRLGGGRRCTEARHTHLYAPRGARPTLNSLA